MRVGVTVGLAGTGPEANRRLVARAEAAGLDSIGVGEAALDSFVAATAVASWTRRVRIVSAVATWARPPVLTALSAASVDLLSGGRYVLGLGTMPPAWNRDHYGIDPSRPLSRMREYVAVVRGALRAHSGLRLDQDGEFFTVRGYRRLHPPLRDDLPVHLAATLPGMARLAGEVGDGVLFNVIHTRSWLHETMLPALAEGAAGRRVERGVMVRVAVGGEASDLLRNSLRSYLRVPYFWEVAAGSGADVSVARAHAAAGEDDDSLRALPSDLVAQFGVAGSAEDVRDGLAGYEDLVDWVLLAPVRVPSEKATVTQTEAILDAVEPLVTGTRVP